MKDVWWVFTVIGLSCAGCSWLVKNSYSRMRLSVAGIALTFAGVILAIWGK